MNRHLSTRNANTFQCDSYTRSDLKHWWSRAVSLSTVPRTHLQNEFRTVIIRRPAKAFRVFTIHVRFRNLRDIHYAVIKDSVCFVFLSRGKGGITITKSIICQ